MDENYSAVFAKNLKQIRKRRGIPQRDLSELCGLSVNAILLFETGRREPKLSELCAIADHFEISTDRLVGRI